MLEAAMMPNIYETDYTPPPEKGDIITRIEYGDGIKVHIEGHPYPYKTYPTSGAIQAIDVIKKLFFCWPFLSLKKIQAIGMVALRPHILKPRFMCACARELRNMIPGDMGLLISHVIEYDSAYRARLQDLLDETDENELIRQPIKEIRRLIKINGERDYRSVHAKIQRIVYVLILALCWPPFKKKWSKSLLSCDFIKLLPDEADAYWLSRRTDYGPNRTNE